MCRLLIPILVLTLLITSHSLPGEPGTRPSAREIETVEQLAQCGTELGNCVVQGIDLKATPIDWTKVNVTGTVFLGCDFRPGDEVLAIQRGATIVPSMPGLPYNPCRSSLYTYAELREGYTPEKDNSLDRRIFDHFLCKGKFNPPIMEAVAQRLHDHAVDDALRDYLEIDETGMPKKRVVAIMGGHKAQRSHPFYKSAALLAHRLAKEGYCISTGGGPGMMEAGNLGAYLAKYDSKAVDDAVAILAEAPDDKHPLYYQKAEMVREEFPHGSESLAIPTWFYGHEPSNMFASHIAKYFSNGIREDVLLATAIHGVVFAPGSAGTMQEVFADAAQNHYWTFGYRSPMVFYGKTGFTLYLNGEYSEDERIHTVVKRLTDSDNYSDLLMVSDNADEIASFIVDHPPKKK